MKMVNSTNNHYLDLIHHYLSEYSNFFIVKNLKVNPPNFIFGS